MDLVSFYFNKFSSYDANEPQYPYCTYAFLRENLPQFSCDDKTIEEIYYFRAYTFCKHIRKDENGKHYITEWLDVPWKNVPISCAVGHHLSELKWFKNASQIGKDYIEYWCENQERLLIYNNWFVYAVWEYCLATGNMDFAYAKVADLESYFIQFESMHKSKLGIYKGVDNYDGMELSISAYGLRPTINSYVYANAFGLYKIYEYGRDFEKAQYYKAFAEDLQEKINKQLFIGDFYYNQPIGLWEEMPRLLPRFSNPNQDFSVKELMGYVPFYFGIAKEEHLIAWKYFSDTSVFSAPYGLTTADMSHPQFNYAFPHMCLWNGPVWPYATSQTLTAFAKTLREYDEKTLPIGKKDYCAALKTYAASQYISIHSVIRPWIDENLDGHTGEWLARNALFRLDRADKERGKDYNHSTFIDLILGGLCGLSQNADGAPCNSLADDSIVWEIKE
jgi:hypothetical protein